MKEIVAFLIGLALNCGAAYGIYIWCRASFDANVHRLPHFHAFGMDILPWCLVTGIGSMAAFLLIEFFYEKILDRQ